ncbi:MAG: hypothetical protein C7B43_18140 [Sulfobacillus benefaciens]|uniref:Uncharacterized protein n=1 Tax=Sulfobacillus benefaciens TaxID=453960 RepID=A0A2T2WRL5_9FIRM|nr:MAG: hypothetical protein C7B43_18140 [Sulfobacillus benefaciens]
MYLKVLDCREIPLYNGESPGSLSQEDDRSSTNGGTKSHRLLGKVIQRNTAHPKAARKHHESINRVKMFHV